MKTSHLSEVFRFTTLDERLIKSDERLKEVGEHVRLALDELTFSMPTISMNALESACNLQSGDENWDDSRTLEEMQAVVVVADLISFLYSMSSDISLRADAQRYLERRFGKD